MKAIRLRLLRHEVDLAIGRAKALGEDAVAFGHQIGGGAAFGREPGAERRDALGRGDLADASGGVAPSVFAIAASDFFRRAPARGHRPRGAAGRTVRPHAPRVLDAVARQRRTQQIVEVVLRHDAWRRPRGGPITSTNSPRVSSVSAAFASSDDRRARDLLVQFCQFAADRGVAPAHDRRRDRPACPARGCRIRTSPAWRRSGQVPQAACGARPASRGKNPSKKNRSVGSAATDSAASTEDGAGHRDHGMAGGADLAHQLEAGIGNQRRAGIRDQRDRGALRQLFQDFWPRQRGVVLVIRLELLPRSRSARSAGG